MQWQQKRGGILPVDRTMLYRKLEEYNIVK
jgi:hypothetical protein